MRHDRYMYLHTQLDRLESELNGWVSLSKQLTNKWMTYASHRQTGLVYDTDMITEQVNSIHKKIEGIKNELDGYENS